MQGIDLERYILGMLSVKGSLTARQIMRIANQPKKDIRPMLDSLVERGYIATDSEVVEAVYFPRRSHPIVYSLIKRE